MKYHTLNIPILDAALRGYLAPLYYLPTGRSLSVLEKSCQKDHLNPLIPVTFPKWSRTTYEPENQAKLCSSQLESFQAKSKIRIAAVELAS